MQAICIDEQSFKKYLYMVLNGKNISKFDGKFIKNYDEDRNKGCIVEVDVMQLIEHYQNNE